MIADGPEPSLGPVTLNDLIRDDKLLWVYCRECGHERDVTPATVPMPSDTPVPDVGKHMKLLGRWLEENRHSAEGAQLPPASVGHL